MASPLHGAKELIVIIDGMDEASCSEPALFQRLNTAAKFATNVRFITLGAEKQSLGPFQSNLLITEDMIFDDIVAVVRGQLDHGKVFHTMSEVDQEKLVTRIAHASNGSFLWARLAARRVRLEMNVDHLRKAVDSLASSKPSVTDLVTQFIHLNGVTDGTRHILLWLATAERPLSLMELTALATMRTDRGAVLDPTHPDMLATLRPVEPLVFLQDGLAYLRHGLIRAAILDLFAKGRLVQGIKDRHEDLVTRLLLYIKDNVTQHHEISLSTLDVHDTNQLLNKNPLLDFAVRHWPAHMRHTSVYAKEGSTGVAKSFSKVLPTSVAAILLQGSLWQHRPAPVLLLHLPMVTDIYRHMLTTKNPVTLQCMIFQAMLYRRVEFFDEAIPLLYDVTMAAQNLLGPRSTVTMQLSGIFLETTAPKMDTRNTELMNNREEMLLLFVECYQMHYGQDSEHVVSALRMLAEHYQMTKQEEKAQKILDSIHAITTKAMRERAGELHARHRGRRERAAAEGGVSLLLDVEEHDELAEGSRSYDFEFSLKQAENYASEGWLDRAEHLYIDMWQRASREYRVHHSDVWEERKLKAILGYSRFLLAQNRETDAASILSTVWEDYKTRHAMTLTQASCDLFHQMASIMKEAGLCTESLSVLKHCAQYYESTNRTQSAMYQEITETIQNNSKEIMEMMSSAETRVTSESTLEEMVLDACKSGSIDQTTLTAVFNLVDLYTSQHRWQDATRLIKRVLRSIWPSLFCPSAQDVTAPSKHVDECVELAERLAQCHHTRRRPTKEGDLRVRIYRAMRTSRKVDDKLRDRVTLHLLRFFENQSQTEKLIKIRQEMLDDCTDHHGPEHPTVIKMLWELAELTRPRPIFVEYYEKIIRTLNKNSYITNSEAFEPVSIVANELWSKGLFSDALRYYKMMFETFLRQPEINGKLQDQSFVREIFTRYTHCLRNIGTEFTVIYKVMADYRAQCKTVFGSNASITIQATLALAKMCQDTERHEFEAIQLYEELLKTESGEINHKDIATTLDSIYEEQIDAAASSQPEAVSATQISRAIQVLKQRMSNIRETHGWAHEESLSKLSELVRLRNQQHEMDLLANELAEAAANVLSTETSSARLIAAASTIASGYIESDQTQRAMELQHELYRQIVMKDTVNTATYKFNISSRGRDSLVFLAQFEYNLRRNSATVNEILAMLTTQYVYFEEVRRLMKSKSSSFLDVTVATGRLHQCLLANERLAPAALVFGDFTNYFIDTEGKRVHLTEPSQVNIFLQTLLQHFSTHKSRDFIRSVGISGSDGVVYLLRAERYEAACDLALATFTYISAHDEYRTPVVAKLVLVLGMTIAGRDLLPQPDEPARRKMLETSSTIVRDVLHVLSELKVSLEQISLGHLNKMIGLLGEQHDYRTLSWLLTTLWHSREAQSNWHPSITLSLAKRYIMAHYLVGDSTAAVRLAEDIVYNCRRVHGTRHPSTLDMSVFLTQLYTSIAQRYQGQKSGGREIANRYYKKSAAVHENILRVFTDPSYAEMEAGLDGTMTDGGSSSGFEAMEDLEQATLPDGQYVCRHLHFLKLALERLGSWPKDYAEYERLNADIFRKYADDLKGVDGVEKWNLSGYGSGKAEDKDDLLDAEFNSWELVIPEDGEDEL